VHLLNVTGKGRFQPVLTAGYGSHAFQMLKERTNAGSQALMKLIQSSGVTQSAGVQTVALLVMGAFAQVEAEAPEPEPMLTDAGPSFAPAPGAAPERMKLDVFAKHLQAMLSTCRPGTFGQGKQYTVNGLSKTAPIGSGVGLLLWTTHEKNASAKGSKMTDATKRCVRRHGSIHCAAPLAHPPASPSQHGITLSDLSPSRLLAAIEILAPKAKAAPRKQGFKVAAALPEAEARNADAGWQGNCGLVDIVRGCESNHGDSLSWLDASLAIHHCTDLARRARDGAQAHRPTHAGCLDRAGVQVVPVRSPLAARHRVTCGVALSVRPTAATGRCAPSPSSLRCSGSSTAHERAASATSPATCSATSA